MSLQSLQSPYPFDFDSTTPLPRLPAYNISSELSTPLTTFSNRILDPSNHSGQSLHNSLTNWPPPDQTSFRAQVLSVASHEMLLSAQNPAYVQLHQRVSNLTKEYEIIQAKYSTLEESYRQLIQVVPQAVALLPSNPLALSPDTSAVNKPLKNVFLPTLSPLTMHPLPLLKESDYPKVRWWTKKQWGTKGNLDEGTTSIIDDDHDEDSVKKIGSTDYLEDTHGHPISAEDRRALYAHAQLIWNSFASAGDPPAGYKQVDLRYLTTYRNEMEREFPILQLCDRHWKADQVWILNYSSWLRNRDIKVQRSKDKAVKSEDHADEKVPADLGSKRKYNADVAMRKKAKMIPDADNKENIKQTWDGNSAPVSSPDRLSVFPPVPPKTTLVEDGKSAPASPIHASILPPKPVLPANPLSTLKITIPALLRTSTIEKGRATIPGTISSAPISEDTSITASASSASPQNLTSSTTSLTSTATSLTSDSLANTTSSADIARPFTSTSESASALTAPHDGNTIPMPIKKPAAKRVNIPASEKPFEPPSGNTARSLCAREWKANNANGTKGEFEAYFKSLSANDIQPFKDEEKLLKKKQKASVRA